MGTSDRATNMFRSILNAISSIVNRQSEIVNRLDPVPSPETPDPFAVVPLIAQGVEAREDSRGMLQIRAVPPPKPGLGSALSRRFGLQRPVRVNLDAYGTAFWKQIDGRRNLRDIERVIRRQTQQDQRESEKATILFTRMLMLRHLICLAVPKQSSNGE